MNPGDPDQTLHVYQRLAEVTRDLASTLDLDTLLMRIVHLAAELNEAEDASILLYEPKKQQLYFQASTDQKNATEMLGIIIPTESIAGWVALHRQPVIVSDVHQDSRFFGTIDQILQFKTRSIVAVPMITKDKLISVLEVLNKHSDTFTPLDQEILTVLAGQAAVAIENTRLFHQSDLIAELVHELRTPLSSINTIAYLLQRPEISTEQRIRLADTIRQESERLNELSTSFLNLARLESGRNDFHKAPFDACELLEDCYQVVQSRAVTREISVTLNLPAQRPPVTADRDKIKQVLLNLLLNAIKFNDAGGAIQARIWYDEERVWFAIHDSGAGITEDMLPHLFEKFFRANPDDPSTPGTGLGLYICKKIVENHAGQIQAFSQENIGTTFQFCLPLIP